MDKTNDILTAAGKNQIKCLKIAYFLLLLGSEMSRKSSCVNSWEMVEPLKGGALYKEAWSLGVCP
jgi:hypothetical protein